MTSSDDCGSSPVLQALSAADLVKTRARWWRVDFSACSLIFRVPVCLRLGEELLDKKRTCGYEILGGFYTDPRQGSKKKFRVPRMKAKIIDQPVSRCKEIESVTYTKRAGTSGIQGHLYETKLLSLIYFRATNDKNIKEFYLATNVDKIGSFDDICFRAKVKNIDKPLSVFIQTKHRENDSVLTLNNKSELAKHFRSYLDIRSKFNEKKKGALFDGKFIGTECFFVIYTTAKSDQAGRKAQGSSATLLNSLIGTEVLGSGVQPLSDYNKAELNQILLEEEMLELARLMAKCIFGEFKDLNMLMQEELVLRYHAVLAKQVFNVFPNQSGALRDASFREDFFDIKEGLVQLFKEQLCAEILKRRKFTSGTASHLHDGFYLCEITDTVDEYQEIKHLISYENQKFEFLDNKASECYKPFLDKINQSQETIRRTVKMAVKQSVPLLKFRVPASFGNNDLTIRGGDDKKEKRLIYLTSKIVGLIDKSASSNIVVLDESVFETLEGGFLQLNGGIASAVGNLLVLDDETKLLKVNHDYGSLGELAKKLFDKLNNQITNLYEYKFDVRVKLFPKLSFDPDEYTQNIVSDFSNKFLFYTSQAKEDKVEKILIDLFIKKISYRDNILTKNVKANTIFLNYHDAIQKWWKKKEGKYLTKNDNLYENAEKDALSQPMLTFINIMQRVNIKNYTFTKDAVNSIKLDEQLAGTVIVTKNITLTNAKLINHLVQNDCIVLDMNYILSLSRNDVETLHTELTDLKDENILIVACDKEIFVKNCGTTSFLKLNQTISNGTAIIVLNDHDSVENAKKYFRLNDNVIHDERNNLVDMSKDTQNSILENTNVIFQGVEVSSKHVLGDAPIEIVGEDVLYKLMQNEANVIGKAAWQLNDKDKLFIERSVKGIEVVSQTTDTNERKVQVKVLKKISTLFDLPDDVVLVIGEPGMGKSTLLTQVSLNTKQVHKTVWLLRIHLLEYSKQFFEWQDKATVIDDLKSLKFLCQVALSESSIKKNHVQVTLEESDGTISLKDCDGDEWTVFELKVFLHYYNTKQIIILFDGFDEICPTYAREVLSLIKVLMNLPQKHKIWITSRSYDKIIAELDLHFFYKMEPLNEDDQDLYLSMYWKNTNLLKTMRRCNISKFHELCMYMCKSDDLLMLKKKSHLPVESIKEKPMLAVYLSLYKYFMLEYQGCKDYKQPAIQFIGLVATPLHLNMLAEHLYNQVFVKVNDVDPWEREECNVDDGRIQWDLDVNLFEIYENFLENKLKIRFQEKNENDLYKPYHRQQYKREIEWTKETLKKLAAYVVYNKRLLDKHELRHCEETIAELKNGKATIDIICNVVNDMPIFVHSTFAEYFAIEHISDLIKYRQNFNRDFDFILNVMFFKLNKNLLVVLDAKINVDSELTSVIEKNNNIIFTLLLKQGNVTKNKHACIRSSLCEAIRLGLRNLAALLFSAIKENLYERYLMDFIEIVKETNMLMVAVKMGFDDLLIEIIDLVKMVRESKLNALFENIEIFYGSENLSGVSTGELVQKLHANVWERMDIVPDWENLRDLGEIYFI